jgi:cysteine-rich repeat protein
MRFIVFLLILSCLSCTPIVESMLLSPRDGSTDTIGPDAPDLAPDHDTAPDDHPDMEDIPVDVPVVTVNTECALTSLPSRLDCYDKIDCGNNSPDCAENCDDGNLDNADGCDPACLFETKICTWAEPVLDPADIVVEGEFLYVSDDRACFIQRIPLAGGDAIIFAGWPGLCDYQDGSPEVARFNYPMGMEVMGSHLFVVDNHSDRVRMVNLMDRTVGTVAGGGETDGELDGPCLGVQFSMPMGIASDGAALYVADTGNSRIAAITEPIGPGCAVHTLNSTGLVSPAALTVNPANPSQLFVADSAQNAIYRIDLPDSVPIAIAGDPGSSGSDNGVGSDATFNRPLGIDCNGVVLIVADSFTHILREVEIEPPCNACRVTLFAGSARTQGCSEGFYRGDAARLSNPRCVDFQGGPEGPYKFFFCDPGCDAVRIGK